MVIPKVRTKSLGEGASAIMAHLSGTDCWGRSHWRLPAVRGLDVLLGCTFCGDGLRYPSVNKKRYFNQSVFEEDGGRSV